MCLEILGFLKYFFNTSHLSVGNNYCHRIPSLFRLPLLPGIMKYGVSLAVACTYCWNEETPPPEISNVCYQIKKTIKIEVKYDNIQIYTINKKVGKV